MNLKNIYIYLKKHVILGISGLGKIQKTENAPRSINGFYMLFP